MSFSLPEILLAIVGYLLVLFLVAHLADRGILPRRITHHPATYVLSLAVIACAIASNAIFELAYRFGYGFLLYYTGVVLMFLMATLLLLPLLRLCRVYQLASLADVLTFRFRSHRVGGAVTLAMCLTLMPLLALQIQAVADSIHILAGAPDRLMPAAQRQDTLALMFCLIIIIFAILFGTRNLTSQRRNIGLVTAVAFESLVKLAAMLLMMAIAVKEVFGGFAGLEAWLAATPAAQAVIQQPVAGDAARVLLLVFFAGAVCMPHLFHMAFAENKESQDLRAASWGLPLYLLLLALPVLPLAWAGMRLPHDLPAGYTGLAIGIGLQSPGFAALAFVAGLSAASTAIIVATLALANMCLNHLILPRQLLQIRTDQSLYDQLKWLRRSLIALLILAGYGFFVAVNGKHSLAQLGLVAFSGTLHFLPGIVATPYWAGANRKGLVCGLAGGLLLWFILLLLPVLGIDQPAWMAALAERWFAGTDTAWAAASLAALGVNVALFVLVSLLSQPSDEERVAAEICSMDVLSRSPRRTLTLRSAQEFTEQLALALGEATAQLEVSRALRELQFDHNESRPYALRRLRGRIEANLSGLLGPAVAHSIVSRCIPFDNNPGGSSEDLFLIERRLDRAGGQFTGLAAELDNLRLHYRKTLDNLPIGVCSLAPDRELLLWNRSMQSITGIASSAVLGSLLESLPPPWGQVIGQFLSEGADTVLKREVVLEDGATRWVSLHKASAGGAHNGDQLVLIEDISDYERLEQELLHSERLASIGRLAAGVAHEIGNPVTGIACLAQNLAYEDDPAEVRSAARDILRQTDRISRIVDSLVNFSHVGSGAGDLHLEPCNLADCVDEAIHLLQLDHQARPMRFENHCHREILVHADAQRLLQVFVNLLGNARDASPADARVTVSALAQAERVAITVEDEGSGIPASLQSQVFEPFFTTKEPGEGTGLGLALVYSIMEDMQGSVHIQSPVGPAERPGTRFTLQLPRGHYDTHEGVTRGDNPSA
ncbi:MAG: histidine kinase [Haliea sp.]|uniref:ATP-binding protein n=1 Tax=Haliea sp. TaxID=1932666 RepID=UPI000C508D97|nr:ATP-binding protein [Haliea sp.]MBM67977.1 histidine kinase [Haliea sp.]|tara:strand:+ start:1585 stop:4584 length:3000 start_codon:yes stop_codon:yes gene_type:complete